MRKYFRGVRQRALQLNLSQRLILGLVLVVVAVILFSGVPANIAMWLQLEQQVWEQVEHAQNSTQALYDAETARLKKLAGLIAGRPTLIQLVQEGDVAALAPYLEALKQESGNLDLVQVTTPTFQVQVGEAIDGLPVPQAFLAGKGAYFADFISLEGQSQLTIVAVSQLLLFQGEGAPEGWVLIAQLQSAPEMVQLEEETGLAQSLVVEQVRIATSLSAAPEEAFNPASAQKTAETGHSSYTLSSAHPHRYYVGYMPLRDSQGSLVGVSEVALAADAIRREMIGTTAVSAGISLAVMLCGAWVIVRLARTITQPLAQLSQAAEQISQGNLEVATPANSGLPEIDQLARQFDLARRQVRQALSVADSEMKHAQRLLASVREGVVALDEDGRVTYFNKDAEHILGYPAEKVLHNHYSRIFIPAPGEAVGLKEILSQPAPGTAAQHVNIINGQGQPLLLSVKVNDIERYPAEGKLAERVLVIRDVTEEEAANRLRINFLANVAHEFRTPLAGIAATSELLVDDAGDLSPEELAQLVGTVQLSTLHLQTLVDNLLESTTIEAGVFQVHHRPVNILEVINRTMTLISPLTNRRDQVLTVCAPAGLPMLWADSNRLTQVLVNLFSNASKFSPSGGKIELVVTHTPGWLKMEVLDCGPGLPSGLFADLFKRFVTASQPHETHYGIGLGLAVVKAIVELHGGKVGAENRPEGGANVWFTLPVHASEEKMNL